MKKLIKLSILSTAVMLTACSDDDNNNSNILTDEVKAICEQTGIEFSAVISTVAADYSGADVELLNVGNGECVGYTSLLPKTESDYTVNAYKDSFYHIGKYNLDSISKYKLNSPQTNLYIPESGPEGYSLPAFSNAYGLEFLSKKNAFLYFYGLDKVWSVDPSSETEAGFKLSTSAIDLSAYNGNDTRPEIFSIKSAEGKVFVFMQRLDTTPVYPDPWIKEGSYVAVYDSTDLNQEIDTGEGSNNLKGIELPVQNPISVAYHSEVGFLLAAVSDYHGDGKAKEGGILKINPSTYASELLIADEASDTAPYFIDGAFSNVAIVDKDNAFLVSYQGWGNNSLYHFNPMTGQPTLVEGISGLKLGALKVDPLGNVWISINDAADPHIKVLSKTGENIGRFSLNQGANAIAFAIK